MEHLKYLAWINYGFAALTGLVGVFVVLMGLLAGGSMLLGNASDAMVGLVITVVTIGISALLVFALAAAYAFAGRAVSAGKGRILQTILAILAVGNLPIGTIYGVYALWVCWANEETKARFDDPYGVDSY